jgi:hypothetical protein
MKVHSAYNEMSTSFEVVILYDSKFGINLKKRRLLVHFWTAHRVNHLPHAAHLRAALQRVIRTALRVRV